MIFGFSTSLGSRERFSFGASAAGTSAFLGDFFAVFGFASVFAGAGAPAAAVGAASGITEASLDCSGAVSAASGVSATASAGCPSRAVAFALVVLTFGVSEAGSSAGV